MLPRNPSLPVLAVVGAVVLLVFPRPAWNAAEPPRPTRTPLVRTVDLNVGESAEVTLSDGSRTRVRLLDLKETRDSVCGAMREARVDVEVNGKRATLPTASYNLPRSVGGVRVDCTVTRGYNVNSNRDAWGLDRDARLRLWPANSALVAPGTFVYPLKQRWFASATQMANEPTYVDAGERPGRTSVYYHNDLDFGGAEGLTEVIAATEGLVVSSADQTLPGYQDTPVRPRYDVVYLLDERGWYYRYSHFHSIDPAVRPGSRVRMGQKLGLLGKEGGSGGWTHLHFGIVSRQPSGKWGTQEAYAFVWEAYLREHSPRIIAVARPHHVAAVGEKVRLDGSRSWSREGKISRYDWTLSDGKTASGAAVERTYSEPGTYSEILKVTDREGAVAYDFAIVNVLDPAEPKRLPPTIHAAYWPTRNLRPGDSITFKVRTFRATAGSERWDFGDGSPPVTVRSDGNAKPLAKDGYAVTEHRYRLPGSYVVRVERTNEHGFRAVGHLHVTVEGNPGER